MRSADEPGLASFSRRSELFGSMMLLVSRPAVGERLKEKNSACTTLVFLGLAEELC